MASCPSCGLPVTDPGASVCSSCGRRLAAASLAHILAKGPAVADMAADSPGDATPVAFIPASAPTGMPGDDTPREIALSATPAAPSNPSAQPTQGATIARAVGITAVAALLSLLVFGSVAFQQLFLTLVFQHSSSSTEYLWSIEGAAFFALVFPLAYWVALVRLRHAGVGRALAETITISLLFGFVVFQLCDLIQITVITWGLPGIDLFAPLRLMWVAPGETAQTYLPALLAAGLGVALATAFAPWAGARRAIPPRDGWRALAIALGSVLLIEVAESALASGFIQVFGLYHAAPDSTRVRVFTGIIRPALNVASIVALYALACVTTLRALRRAS